MKFLLPSIRYLVPVVAFLLLGQVGFAQAGCSAGDWSYNISDADGQVALPSPLGSGLVDYVIIDIFLDGTCSKRFNISSTIFETDCNIIEYYNSRGNFVGVEDQDRPGSSTFIFDDSDLDGMPGTPGRPSGVEHSINGCSLGATTAPFAYDDGYSPDYFCDYTPSGCSNGAEAGQFYFFRVTSDGEYVNAGALVSSQKNNTAPLPAIGPFVTGEFYHFLENNPGPWGQYRAVFIRSVRDGSPPVIKGSFATDICATPDALDNAPTDLVGDPRSIYNTSNTILTDNDRAAGRGSAAGYNAQGVTPRDDQVRALLCTEETDPYTGGPTLNYGWTDPINVNIVGGIGAGYIDADANDNNSGDIDMAIYNGITSVNVTALNAADNTVTIANTVRNTSPDGCEGAVTVSYTDDFTYSPLRGNIYDEQTTINADFGTGQDGRFLHCYRIDRRWIATDEGGSSSTCVQTIDIIEDYEGDVCNGGNGSGTTGNMIEIQDLGSPHFTNVTVSGNTVEVTPQPDDMLTCRSAVANIYATAAMDPLYPTLYKYTNPNGSFPANIVAVSYADITGTDDDQDQGIEGSSNTAVSDFQEHYNFPVFVYEEDLNIYTCSEESTLDEFIPLASDNCDVQPVQEIESLYDRGGDGDFGDIGPNPIFSNSDACPFYDSKLNEYFNNGSDGDPTVGVDQASDMGALLLNDDNVSSISPATCEFYTYDVLKRWVVEDNCGFRSIAQRIYHISDNEAPDLSSASITISGSILNYAPSFSGVTTDGVFPNVKTYELPNTLVLPYSCSPNLFINVGYQDACAANQYIDIQYNVEEFNASTGVYVISPAGFGNIYNTSTGVTGLQPNKLYRITFQYFDPCGNRTDFEIPVQTLASGTNACPSTPYSVDFNNNPAGVGTLLDMFRLSDIIAILNASCTPITDLELQLTSSSSTAIISGGVTAAGSSTVSTSGNATGCLGSASASVINSTASLPSIDFSCIDIGTNPSVTLNIYDCSSGTSTLFASCSRTVNVFTTANLGVIASPQDASSTTATDGQIALDITSPSNVTETYNISWVGSNGVTGSQSNTQFNYIISNLPMGTYTVTATGNSTCASAAQTVSIGTSTPLQLQYSCPATATAGQPYVIGLAPTGTFTGLDFIRFGVQVTGTAGATIQGISLAPGFSPSIPTTNACSGTEWNVIWSDNTGIGENITSMIDFISIEVIIPVSAPVGSTVNLVVTDLYDCASPAGTTIPGTAQATQAPTGQPVPLALPSGACTFSVTTPSTGNLSVGGNITFMGTSTGVSNTSVTYNNNTGGSMATSTTGSTPSTYNFTGVTTGDDIEVCPTKTGLGRAAITPMDITKLSAYVSNPGLSAVHMMTNPYQLVAADINQDGVVDPLDLIAMNSHLLFTPGATIDNWVFIESSQALPLPTTTNIIPPLNVCYDNSNYMSSLTIGFVGVKLGDIDESLSGSLLVGGDSDVEDRGVKSFIVDDRAIEAGEEVTIKFGAKDFKDIWTYRAHLNFNEDYLDFIGLDTESVLPDLDVKNFGLSETDKGDIFTLWYGLEPTEVKNGDQLFGLRFKVLKSANSLKGILTTRSTKLPTEIYSEQGVSNLDLEFANSKDEFRLYPTSPNPFSDRTKVSFDLPKASEVALTVTDLTGRVVYSTRTKMDAGYNTLFIEKQDLSANGVYYYHIEAAGYKASNKVVLID